MPEAGNVSPVPVDVRLNVTEGPRTVVGAITVAGQTAVDEAALRAAITSRTGQPYYQQQVAVDGDGMLLVLLNRGYPSAAVYPRVVFTRTGRRPAVAFVVAEGPQVFVEHVLIVGNVKTSTEMIRREVTLQPGAPLSYAELTESQRRISALGLFRRVRITELDHGEPNRRDLLVTVEEAPATTVGYGGGVEGGRAAAPSRTWRRRHRGVRGRAARVCRVRPTKSLRPQPVDQRVCACQPCAPRRPRPRWPKAKRNPAAIPCATTACSGTYRLPRIVGHANDLLVTGFLEQGLRSSFNFARRGARGRS